MLQVAAAADPVLERLLDERIIYLSGELDDAAADQVITQLLLLGALAPRPDITLYINSTAGSVSAAMAVHDTMRAIDPDVATRAVGLVGSVGQFLLTAGTAGKRQAFPHSRIQLRRPSIGVVRVGVGEQLRTEIMELTAGYTGRPAASVEADAAAERWFTAAEAVAHGLVDGVVGA